MKSWDELTLVEKIDSSPDRHPWPFKCMLYLAFSVCPVPWEAVDRVMLAMGYVKVDVRLHMEGGLSFGAPTLRLPGRRSLKYQREHVCGGRLMRACRVVDDNSCEGGTNMECFACGQPACSNCTIMVQWFFFGDKRICFDCADEEYPVQVARKRKVLRGA